MHHDQSHKAALYDKTPSHESHKRPSRVMMRASSKAPCLAMKARGPKMRADRNKPTSRTPTKAADVLGPHLHRCAWRHRPTCNSSIIDANIGRNGKDLLPAPTMLSLNSRRPTPSKQQRIDSHARSDEASDYKHNSTANQTCSDRAHASTSTTSTGRHFISVGPNNIVAAELQRQAGNMSVIRL